MTASIPIEHSMWAYWPTRISRHEFRREGDYLAQLHAGMTEANYLATLDYVKSIDRFGYLDLFTEDDAFGVTSFQMDGRTITRDLLDSILEIYFLHDAGFTQQDAITVLDIGAGYGRFAHRLTAAFPRAFVYCADAIPMSTEICARYLKYRGVDRARAIAMETAAWNPGSIDLAVNIHSWSECPLSAIRVWLRILEEKRVPNLFMVPHTPDCLTIELDHTAQCFLPVIVDRMKIMQISHKFPPTVQGLYPTDYFLFEANRGLIS